MDAFENVFVVTFGIGPAAVIGCALVNMLITWQFSWSELILDYLIGLAFGLTFYFGTVGEVNHLEYFFLTVSTGFFGLLKWFGAFSEMAPGDFFLLSTGVSAGAVLLTGALDYGAVAIGWSEGKKGANVALSILIFLLKWPFALVTSTVGLIIGLIGLAARAGKSEPVGDGVGFAGGVFWFEWGSNSGYHATTFGCVVNAFRGTISDTLAHELVHTRQYIYMHDWLGVFYFTIAGLWGVISSAASSDPYEGRHLYAAHDSKEVGNPIEMVPTHKYG